MLRSRTRDAGVLPGPVDAAIAARASGWLWRLATSRAPVGDAVDAIASDRLLVRGV